MSAQAEELLTGALADYLATLLDQAEPGHCVRVDDVDAHLSGELAQALRVRLPEVSVNVLRDKPQTQGEIRPERAIELRNRKTQPCLLLVPAGEGHAASSLDNSFLRLPMLDVFHEADQRLAGEMANPALLDPIRRLRRHLAKANREAWAEFVAAVAADPTEQTFGRNLWRIGLVPDLGEDPASRVEKNRVTVKVITRPVRPSATIDERLTAAGLKTGSRRAPLRDFLEQQGAQLSNARTWTRLVADERTEFSFDRWEFADVLQEELESLQVAPFRSPNGELNKRCKLKLGGDEQLMLEVPEDGDAPIVLEWETEPRNVLAVAQWRLDVLPPADLRKDETGAIATATVAGRFRRATVRVSVDEDDLAEGSHFVVVLTALGDNGEEISLVSGQPAVAESQEFQIVLGDSPETKVRRAAAPSIPEAVVRAALDGLDDLTEDLVTWDLNGQVFGLRLGNRRAIQVRINELIIRLQREATADPVARHHVGDGEHGSPLELSNDDAVELTLPPALKRARSDFLTALRAGGLRDTVESADWTDQLRDTARGYAASYKRAVEAAEGKALTDLLLLDTVSLRVRRSNEVVRAVIVLPIHPLRLMWAATHDSTLRECADALTQVTPRTARRATLSLDMISRVVPANLPFSVPHLDGATAIYAEELTFCSGLFMVPAQLDSDAAAESISSVLGIDRAGSTMRASSRLVAQRIRAYELSHDPGAALRVLSINPGSAELSAGALAALDPATPADDEASAAGPPRRSEVIAYTDSWSYVRPVPALIDLQDQMRQQERAGIATHLAPPLSLVVRPLDSLLNDETQAHLAILQDPGSPVVGLGAPSERKPSFRDLLVPLVTSSFEDAGDLIWESVPSTGPTTGGADSDLVVLHRTHQRAMGRAAGGPADAVPAVRVLIDGDALAQIRAVHHRSDWVIGVDKFVGVDLFETGLSEPYILDYAPDFVEGVGDRLTVTTTHRAEVEHLLKGAMTDLGLDDVESSVGAVLTTLSVVSGRLALRLLENTTQAREAVSLAALVSHLRQRRELDDLIVVPVDAHPEIFGSAVRDEGNARRCDLLLVRLGQRSFKIECIEVKSRKEAHLAQALADTIVEQLNETRRVLEARFFSDPPRIDAELQVARLTSLLHYYADRSATHGLIVPERLADIHRYIDRVEQNRERAEITMRGYIISLEGAQGFKKKYGDVPMYVLTADDLGQLGLSTKAQLITPEVPHETAVPAPHTDAQGRHKRAETFSNEPTGQRGSEVVPAGRSPSGHLGEERPVEPAPARSVPDDERTPDSATLTPSAEHAHPGSGAEGSGTSQHGRPREVDVVLGEDAGGSQVNWRVSTKGSPHCFTIGIPGQGKSVTTRKIIRDFSRNGLPALVFDFHGDMAADPPEGAVVLNAEKGLPFSPFDPDTGAVRRINSTAWEIAEVIAYVAKLGEIQRNHAYKALLKIYADHGWAGDERGATVPTVSEFGEALEEVEKGATGKNARARLTTFTDFGLFLESADKGFQLVTDPPHGWVIDVSQLMEEVQRFAASFILRRAYREMFSWPQDGTMKLAVVLDEAHRMAKDVTLPKIMKEGRKYGVAVIVASQSADDFHKDVIGNAGTKIVFRTNFPASKTVGAMLRGRSGVDLSQEIEKLNVGVAFVSTPDVAQARKVYMAAE